MSGSATDSIAETDSFDLSPQARQGAAQALLLLDEADLELVQELKTRDREVRAHEAAHAAAAGPFAASGPSFTFQQGPDGQRYAVGGEVQIDVSPIEGDPEATIRKMQVVRAAALAPANPSSQDRAVAAAASQQEAKASVELAAQNHVDPNAVGEAAPTQKAARGQLFDAVV